MCLEQIDIQIQMNKNARKNRSRMSYGILIHLIGVGDSKPSTLRGSPRRTEVLLDKMARDHPAPMAKVRLAF
jgi:hypothetical protein